MDRIIHANPFFMTLFCLMLILPCQAVAENDIAQDMSTLTLYMENDFFYKTDRQYTHGMKLSWISPDLTDYRDNPLVPAWSYPLIECLPFINDPGYQRSISLSLGQNMYTPEEIERSDLVEDDRPYAGMTYLAIGFHSKNDRQMDTLEFDVGIIGPHSYVEEFQKVSHRWIAATDPQGWEHQLHDEPIINVFFERKWRLLRAEYNRDLGFDFIPHIGGSFGNAFTGANAGGEIRFGWNLPNDFGTYIIRPGSDSNAPVDNTDPRLCSLFRRAGVHLFFAVDGTAVAHNILLDGNTFRDSHSVDKKHFVACFVGGIGIIAGRFKITYSHVYQTKEFKTQEKEQQYGAMSLSYTF
ncbi:MAG: lipid A deacylase LpxR family protein [Thermodesulfobacteriota bacterium]|nr:lipid A deacylase LpxR family protein [Thermodesulfobacteriota bacterium]